MHYFFILILALILGTPLSSQEKQEVGWEGGGKWKPGTHVKLHRTVAGSSGMYTVNSVAIPKSNYWKSSACFSYFLHQMS